MLNIKHACVRAAVVVVTRCEAWEIDEHAAKVDRKVQVEAVRHVAPGVPAGGWDSHQQQQLGYNKQHRAGISIELVRVGFGVDEAILRFSSQGEAAVFLGTSNAQVSLRKRSGKPIHSFTDGFEYIVRKA